MPYKDIIKRAESQKRYRERKKQELEDLKQKLKEVKTE